MEERDEERRWKNEMKRGEGWVFAGGETDTRRIVFEEFLKCTHRYMPIHTCPPIYLIYIP